MFLNAKGKGQRVKTKDNQGMNEGRSSTWTLDREATDLASAGRREYIPIGLAPASMLAKPAETKPSASPDSSPKPKASEDNNVISQIVISNHCHCESKRSFSEVIQYKVYRMLLLIKTTALAYSKLETFIEKIHPYDCPEIIGIPIELGLKAYLQWIADNVDEGV
jgi:uncharacterized protein involved in tolerance to divalent cations